MDLRRRGRRCRRASLTERYHNEQTCLCLLTYILDSIMGICLMIHMFLKNTRRLKQFPHYNAIH